MKNDYKNYLEKYFFQCKFEIIKNHSTFKELNLSDKEIIDNHFIIKKHLECYLKCNEAKKKCGCLGCHYRFFRDHSFNKPKLVYEVYECNKLLDIGLLSEVELSQIFNNQIDVYKIPVPKYNESQAVLRMHMKKSHPLFQAVANINKQVKNLHLKKDCNLFLQLPCDSIDFDYTFLQILWISIFYLVQEKSYTINLSFLYKILIREHYNKFKKIDGDFYEYQKIFNAPILIINNFDDNNIPLEYLFLVNELIYERILQKQKTLLLSHIPWATIFQQWKIKINNKKNFVSNFKDLEKFSKIYQCFFKFFE